MITENDLRQAIAECQGTRNPNANTCIKLAAYYTILNNLNPKDEISNGQSFLPMPEFDDIVPQISTQSEFVQECIGKDIKSLLGVLDEHFNAIKLLYPKEYDVVLEKIKDL